MWDVHQYSTADQSVRFLALMRSSIFAAALLLFERQGSVASASRRYLHETTMMSIHTCSRTLQTSLRIFLGLAALLMFLQGCGGGGGGGNSAAPPVANVPPPAPTPPAQPTPSIPSGLWQADAAALPKSGNYVYLKSEAGATVPDFIGAGQTYLYGDMNQDQIHVSMVGGRLNFAVFGTKGNYLWSGDFQGAGQLNPLKPGYYGNARRYPFQTPAEDAMAITHHALERACNQLNGWFIVDRIEYVGDKPAVVDLRFEQHCEGQPPALHGQIHWVFDTSPRPLPGPLAIPGGLWRADPAQLPASGNYAYLKSDLGDYSADFNGNPTENLFTSRDARFDVTAIGGSLTFNIRGDRHWDSDFRTRDGLGRIEAGYYGDMGGIFDPERGQLKWSGPGGAGGARTGGTYQSWIVVDRVVYEGDKLVEIDFRFEQHGGGMRAALRGQVHWNAADTTAPPGPANPPPAGLWQPAAGVTPATGNFVYLQSEAGDYIGAGQSYLYTPANAEVTVAANPGELEMRVIDQELWIGTFRGPDTMTRLQPGYYAGLFRFPNHNPTRGAMDWTGHSRGCNALSGWFVIDRISYSDGQVSALDLRFEQHCENATAALRGAMRWTK